MFATDKLVKLPGDLAGLKLRTPSKFGSSLFDMVGASGVGIPAPQVYENLERGVVQGAVWVMDAYRTFRLNEVAPYITSTHFTASPMAILMNRRTYEALSAEDKAVLDAMSGRKTAEWIASVIDSTDAEVEAAFRANKDVTIHDLSAEEKAAWDAALSGAPAAWAGQQPDAAAAQAVLTRATALSAQ
ncbi:MAG: TRAP transporter substrate-binding protein DctP [Neomegalonema sp.]|nr:TRAP transporter substrate-binding protein DctP [Neomegalonema sp.]